MQAKKKSVSQSFAQEKKEFAKPGEKVIGRNVIEQPSLLQPRHCSKKLAQAVLQKGGLNFLNLFRNVGRMCALAAVGALVRNVVNRQSIVSANCD
jgi:hypothetical protein